MDNYLYEIGARFKGNNGSVAFSVWAPQKTKVELVINDATRHSMTVDAMGYWSVTLENILPGTKYCYSLENGKPLPDPASKLQPSGVHQASAVVAQDFDWTDQNWKGLALGDMIIYELHVGTFTSQGDFDGIINKLDYLVDLGVNAIEIMPVAQFPGSRNWGYDGVFPFAVQHSYGGPSALKRLVNAAHKKGIAIILDVVYNHQGPEGNYFSEFAPYFSDKYKTFWGSAINFDNALCDGVRNFYFQNALMWLNEFHIDGLRMDAVHAIWDFSARHFIEELTGYVTELEKQTGKQKVLIAEIDLNSPRYINKKDVGGYGMAGQWIDEFHHALHALVTGEVDGYYEDFGSISHLAKAIQNSYVYTGQYSIHRKKKFGVLPQGNPYSQFVVFAQNHDQIGNRMLGDRLSTQLSFESLKLIACTVLLAPQVPMLFMGEEYGEQRPFQYFISHTDEALVAMVRKGRKEEFSYFKWQGEVPDPQSEKTFEQCVLPWIEPEGNAKKLFKLHKALINLRKQHSAFKVQTHGSVKVHDVGKAKCIAYERYGDKQSALIILNFDDQVTPYSIAEGNAFVKIFDSAALEWGGPGELSSTHPDHKKEFILQPHSAVVYQF